MGETVSSFQGVAGAVSSGGYAGAGNIGVGAHAAEVAWGAVPYVSWTDETSGDEPVEVEVGVQGLTDVEPVVKRGPGRPRKEG
jgi:hypothetical protein